MQACGEGSKATIASSTFRWNSQHCIACLDGATVEVSGSQLARNDACCVLASGAASSVKLVDTCILDSTGVAIRANYNAAVTATNVDVVRCSNGAEAESQAHIVYEKGCMTGCSLWACRSSGGASLCLSQVQIDSTAGRALHTSGAGSCLRCAGSKLLRSAGTQVFCELGAEMILDDVHVAEGAVDGIVVSGPTSSATISACHIVEQQGAALCVDSARLTFTDGNISSCGSVASIEDGGDVNLRQITVSKCQGGLLGTTGACITVASSTFTQMSGAAALCLRNPGTGAHLQACSMEACMLGGVLVGPGAACEVRDCQFKFNYAPCLHSHGAHAELKLVKCTLDGNIGPGISVADRACATAHDTRIIKTEGNALCVDGVGSKGQLQHCNLEDTGSHVVVAHDGGSCVVDNCSVKLSRSGAGLVALGEGSSITCSHSCVTDMQQAACVVKHGAAVHCDAVCMQGTTCGSGAVVAAGGLLTANDCSIQENSDHGVLVAEGGRAQLQACRCDSALEHQVSALEREE